MIRAVLDANVLISGLLSRQGPPAHVLDAWLKGRYQLCVSPAIMDELARVLAYPRIARRLGPEDAEKILNSLSALAELVEVKTELNVLTRDRSDNAYLACAVEAGAAFLVTGNLAHFGEAGEVYQDVRIFSPRAFLEILGRG